MEKLLIYPMAAVVLHITIILLIVVKSRTVAVKNKSVHHKYFKSYQGYECPEELIVKGRHFDNQFQIPILFLITCLAVAVLGKADPLDLLSAWTFVISRVFHSFVHLGRNFIPHRMIFYGIGILSCLAIWVKLVIQSF